MANFFQAQCRFGHAGWSGPIRPNWIEARLDSLAHKLDFHPRRLRRSVEWEDLLVGPDTPDDTLLPRGRRRRPRHAQRSRASVRG